MKGETMKKKFVPYLICWMIFLAIFHVIVFVTPSEIAGVNKFGGGFWIGYGFTLAAFFGQLFCAWLAFKESEKRKRFYNLPLVFISYITLILTAVVGIVFMTVPQYNHGVWRSLGDKGKSRRGNGFCDRRESKSADLFYKRTDYAS